MSETATKLIRLAAERFKVPAGDLVAGDDLFEKLGINSLEALDLLSDLENVFDVELPDYELQGVSTFGDLAAKIDARR